MHFKNTIIFCIIFSVLFMAAETKVKNKKNKSKTKNKTKNPVAKIVGGTATTISRLPYLVNLRQNGRFFCGGTLINSYFVVTAGHCVAGISRTGLTVVGGQTRLSSGGVRRSVSKIMIPSTYNSNSLHNDVAVLKLSSAMTGTNIKPIGLCNKSWKNGELVQVSGWGLTRETANKVPDNVQTVFVPIIDKTACARSYRGYSTLTSSMFCASVPGKKDSCQGDSGGPVIYGGRLCGIVSWGIGCARSNFPGVYTNVRNVASYINSCLSK